MAQPEWDGEEPFEEWSTRVLREVLREHGITDAELYRVEAWPHPPAPLTGEQRERMNAVARWLARSMDIPVELLEVGGDR